MIKTKKDAALSVHFKKLTASTSHDPDVTSHLLPALQWARAAVLGQRPCRLTPRGRFTTDDCNGKKWQIWKIIHHHDIFKWWRQILPVHFSPTEHIFNINVRTLVAVYHHGITTFDFHKNIIIIVIIIIKRRRKTRKSQIIVLSICSFHCQPHQALWLMTKDEIPNEQYLK